MSAGGRFPKLLRERCLYTGESYSNLKNSRVFIDSRRPIPEATGDQAALEAQVMEYVAAGSFRWAHPVGISRVDITPDGGTLVHLDRIGGVIDRRTRTYPMADSVVCQLLPWAQPGIQVDGAPGLRVKAVEGRDLHLTRAGGGGSVVLRGAQGTRWRQDLAERRRFLEKKGCPPLWEEAELSRHECDDEARYPATRKASRDLAWLGSGLLRRIALVHAASSAYSTRSWISDGNWIIELTTQRRVPLDHDRLLARLTDPRGGLPVRVSHSHCSCEAPPHLHDQRYSRTCTYSLVHDGRGGEQRRGGLQLRFYHDPFPGIDVRETLEIAGADQTWLDRVTPRRSRGDSSGA